MREQLVPHQGNLNGPALTLCAGYLRIAKSAVYHFSLDLGHATSYFISSDGPNDGAILALDGDDLIAMNGASL